jgi:hypothetical protein
MILKGISSIGSRLEVMKVGETYHVDLGWSKRDCVNYLLYWTIVEFCVSFVHLGCLTFLFRHELLEDNTFGSDSTSVHEGI